MRLLWGYLVCTQTHHPESHVLLHLPRAAELLSAVMQPERVAKGRMSKAAPTTGPRHGDWRGRWKDTLCCRPAVGETGRSSVLPGCLLHPVLLCHS